MSTKIKIKITIKYKIRIKKIQSYNTSSVYFKKMTNIKIMKKVLNNKDMDS